MSEAPKYAYMFILVLFFPLAFSHAEYPNIVMLADQKFDPIAVSEVRFGGDWKLYRVKEGDISIATLTMQFFSGEIGQDYDAAHTLAKKQAAKIGADLLLYISGTVIKNTQTIDSITYRCIRTGSLSRKIEREQKMATQAAELEQKKFPDLPPYLFKTSLVSSVVQVSLRQMPKIDSQTIYIVPENSTVYVLRDVNDTYCEAYVNGHRGYISKNYLERKP